MWRLHLGHLGLSDTQRFLILALLIGVFSGLLVVLFHITIDFISWSSLGALSGRFRFGRLLSPSLGAIAAVLIVRKIFPRARGSGVNQTKIAIYSSEGYVPPSTIAGKFLACAVSIGSGNSLGPEDPSLQMGAGVASLLGRLFHLPRNNMRLIAPVGAAAGIAAAFNTPISGVLFVMEEVLADWSAAAVGSIVLAAVSAVVTMRAFLGDEPLFRIPTFELTHISELLIYAGIGIAGGGLSALFIWLIEQFKKRIDHLP
ncbi:MAG: chloride channel protein, partial [Acidobacteriaceae bacterium]|nr:chloride channel protein [Acidobacteriaceae bacterium]